MTWLKWFGPSIGGLLVLITTLITYGCRRWTGFTAQLLARLDAARMKPQPGRFDARELDLLPTPVQQFFRAALSDGMPLVAAASIEQAGTFNIGETSDQWKDFTSTQRVVARRPGFVGWTSRCAAGAGGACARRLCAG